jgi:hypothetical protein
MGAEAAARMSECEQLCDVRAAPPNHSREERELTCERKNVPNFRRPLRAPVAQETEDESEALLGDENMHRVGVDASPQEDEA